jgi:hypothetical protein
MGDVLTPAGRLTRIIRTWVAIVAVQGAPRKTGSFLADIPRGAGVAVAAGNVVEGLVEATENWVTTIHSTRIAIIAVERGTGETLPACALVGNGAGILVCTGQLVVKVNTAETGEAVVRRAGILVITIDIGGEDAFPLCTHIALSTGIAVIAGKVAQRQMEASLEGVAAILRALVAIIAHKLFRAGLANRVRTEITDSAHIVVRARTVRGDK